MNVSDSRSLAEHAIYEILFKNKKEFTPNELTTLMTVIIGHKPWSWRVVGITHAALEQLKQQDFRHKAGSGIQRAHQTSRHAMTCFVFERENPMTADELFDYWRATDRTVICARGENKEPFTAAFIPIQNDDGNLFTTQRINFRLNRGDREFLAQISAKE